MRPLSALLLAVFAALMGCVNGSAQTPKEYKYGMPCNMWREPAHIAANQSAGRVDTTLALLSGRIVNYDSSNYRGYDTHNPVYIVLEKDDFTKKEAAFTDKTGAYRLYVPAASYRVKFAGLDFSPFSVEEVVLRPGEERQLDVFLHVVPPTAGTCMTEYKSKRKLSPKQLEALTAKFAKQDEERTRRYLQRLKAESGAKSTP